MLYWFDLPVFIDGLCIPARQYPGSVGARQVEHAVAEELRELVELGGVVAAAEHLVQDKFRRAPAPLIELIAVPVNNSNNFMNFFPPSPSKLFPFEQPV